MNVIIGAIILELVLLLLFKKVRKYISEMLILNITTIIIYFLLMSNPFLREHMVLFSAQFVILILSISISLLIDTIFVAIAQKIRQRNIINHYEQKYKTNDFDYYRDILKEESPGILSICYNTRKVNFKDLIVSILLSLKQRNIINILENDIEIIGDSKRLKNHEKLVLEYMECKYSPKKFKKEFYSMLIKDSEIEGYIFNKEVNMTEFAQIVIACMVILILIILFLAPFCYPLLQLLRLEEDIEKTGNSGIGSLIFLAYAVNFLSIPIYKWIENRINLIVRTNSGFELCGKLKGLKNFLKDFSKLSDSELKQMELYEEYVIYSVVLNLKGNIDRESRRLYDRLLSFPKEKIKIELKKYNYQLEVINKKIVTPVLFIGSICFFMIVSLIIEKVYGALFVLLIPLLVFLMIAIIVMMKKRNFQKRRDIILTLGTKVPGVIVEKEEIYHSGEKNSYYEYYVIVKFEYQGQVQKYKTPILNFSIHRLMSDDVDVYVYHGYCYVDNFKLKEGIK